MKKSKHFQARTNHRGITEDMVSLVYQYGTVDHNKERVTLSKSAAEELLETMRTLIKIIDKGGVELVTVGEELVTAYRLR